MPDPSHAKTVPRSSSAGRKRSAADAQLYRSLGLGYNAHASSHQHGNQRTDTKPAPSPFQRLPLSASAPVRPGKTGDVIGGRAPTVGNDWMNGRNGAGVSSGVSNNTARAHQGAVTCVMPTADGLFWLTAGTDSRLRLWDEMYWHRRISGCADTHNSAIRARQLATTQDGSIVFHPSGSIVQVTVFYAAFALIAADL